MNVTIRPRMLNLLEVKCDAECGNNAQIQIEFSSPVKWRMCNRCYNELQIATTKVSQSRIDNLVAALEECRDIGEQDVMAVADKALKEERR